MEDTTSSGTTLLETQDVDFDAELAKVLEPEP